MSHLLAKPCVMFTFCKWFEGRVVDELSRFLQHCSSDWLLLVPSWGLESRCEGGNTRFFNSPLADEGRM